MTDIDRRQLKGPDEFENIFSRLISFIEDNFKPLIVVILASLAIVFGVLQWQSKKQEKLDVAFMEYFNLLRERDEILAQTTSPDLKPWVEQASRLVQKFPDDLPGGLIRLQLAEYHFKNREWDKVSQTLEPLTKGKGKHILLELSQLNHAYTLEEKGDFQQSLAAFEKIKSNDSPFFATEGYFGAARCLEKLGKSEEAMVIYGEIEKKYPDTPYSRKASLYAQVIQLPQTQR